ncbi:hypothetical protein [Aliiglaciecola sp. LCG003]|uniref:hypothetical protein n=1 Tax=Aliiglaciecola sp. LCG003 TaxID=3053655 RepID=UPI002572CDFE|nr:hypothetical protein [Aliiglaciecola sp. LCG003]WJG09531.1 hypothetical protein QR722_00405 [Aliiglaciecola sp. LCG003]
MTDELLLMRNSICMLNHQACQQQRQKSAEAEQAQRDQQFNQFLNRLDKLRSLAKARGVKAANTKRLQKSFTF